MSDPVLVEGPSAFPVSLSEAKMHLRVTHNDEDDLISTLIEAATNYLDGADGILGRAILTQTWRQEWDDFGSCLTLRMGPVMGLVAVSYTDGTGVVQTITNARLIASGGISRVLPAVGEAWPSGSSVTVEYTAGYDFAPAPLKAAILLHVGSLYENRETVSEKAPAVVPMAYEMLIHPYRRVLV